MKKTKRINMLATGFIIFSAISLFSVSVMAFLNPQDVMDLVAVELNNTDAYSSIRGIYGGVGLAIVISLLYLAWKDKMMGLAFLCMIWGFYALSRLITIFAEGTLGEFGNNWLVIESTFFLVSLSLLLLKRNKLSVQTI